MSVLGDAGPLKIMTYHMTWLPSGNKAFSTHFYSLPHGPYSASLRQMDNIIIIIIIDAVVCLSIVQHEMFSSSGRRTNKHKNIRVPVFDVVCLQLTICLYSLY